MFDGEKLLFIYVLLLILTSAPKLVQPAFAEEWRDTASHSYPYSGRPEIFTSPEHGTYRVELWGASTSNGSGAYVRGDISLETGEKLYVYVGGRGINASNDPGSVAFNGGGRTGIVTGNAGQGYIGFSTGSGATDVRMRGGAWDEWSSLRSRIMVAAGSGGAWDITVDTTVGRAGGLTGYSAPSSEYYTQYVTYGGNGGSQTSGGAATSFDQRVTQDWGLSGGEAGRFGAGGRGGAGMPHGVYYYGGYGGGGGYYGGGGSSGGGYTSSRGTAGGGGSSYISGHAGCVAISQAGDQSPENGDMSGAVNISASIHHSGKYFINTVMIDGAGYSWTHIRGERTETPNPEGGTYPMGSGHRGDGFARITQLSTTELWFASSNARSPKAEPARVPDSPFSGPSTHAGTTRSRVHSEFIRWPP
jgi:hypothetical protein